MKKTNRGYSRLIIAIFVSAIALSSVLHAQEETRRLSLEKSQTLTFDQPDRPGKIELRLVNATVSVRAESRSDVLMLTRYQEMAKGEEAANWSTPPKELRIEKNNNVISIFGPDEDVENVQYLVDLRVPRRTALSVNTVNSGRVDATDLLGDVDISTTNGSVALRGLEGSVLVNTVNGSIDLYPGALTPDLRWDVNTMNGDIQMQLERSLSATLELQTFHGEIKSEIDLEPDGTRETTGRQMIRGKRNGGGARLSVSTMNGIVRVRAVR